MVEGVGEAAFGGSIKLRDLDVCRFWCGSDSYHRVKKEENMSKNELTII